uniref:Uncharacterized protein n=1 Tax=Sphaerodactylus townsendi TaxID=933632 RepID=A0ACB8EX72_9SAUR
MLSILPTLVFLAISPSVLSQVVLTQTGRVVKKPGESHKLTCAVTGFNPNSHWMVWVRQKPGKGLECIIVAPVAYSQLRFSKLVFSDSKTGAFSDVQLVSSGPGTLRPGQNLNLVCTVTGFSINTQHYAWNWIRQAPGKGLEWVAWIYPYDGTIYYAPSLQSRTTISADTSKNQFSLQLNSVTAADSAVYFCARWSQ